MNAIRVILADDHEAVLNIVARSLQPEFEVVATVKDGAALLDAVEQLGPDLVVLDISMPTMDGIQAARCLKASGARAKIVFLTVHEKQDYAPVCLEAGASGYVVKSRLATDLAPAIKEALAGHSFVSG